jgi:thiol-disulfide isomerase/thioredoxin
MADMNGPVLSVVCLCAQWCGTCRDYVATFDQLQSAMPGHRYRWIDIEDEADLVGDVDVETFPTLMLVHGTQVLFAGPVLPRLGDAVRLLATQVELLATGHALSLKQAGLPEDQVLAYEALARSMATNK